MKNVSAKFIFHQEKKNQCCQIIFIFLWFSSMFDMGVSNRLYKILKLQIDYFTQETKQNQQQQYFGLA